ncbi:alkaline phosphatase family protein [bacterium]|nr:MAG: alkaline phosphatase family protein [bacterium]
MTGLLALAALALPAQLPTSAPKLVVVISIDQGRADFVDRLSGLYLPAKSGKTLGGFRWLSEKGVRFTDAHHHHLPTYTGPGHSILTTGSVPALNGIVGNEWFVRETGKEIYVTQDDSVKTVGGDRDPQSARNLKVSTVGDELKMATNGRSKVVGVAFKDRGSILMAGHAADEVVWYDYGTGNLVTSTYYAPDGKLPSWAQTINDSRAVDAFLGKSWTPTLPESAFINSRNAPHEKGPKMFSHPYGTQKNTAYFSNVVRSGGGQEFIFDVAEKAIEANKLGQHDVPDMFVLNLATNDYVGHAWGPYSPESTEVWAVTDRRLSRLFNKLDKWVPGGIDNVAIVVSADHGVAPIPGEAADVYHMESSRSGNVTAAIESSLDKKYGDVKWVLYGGHSVYLNRAEIAAKGLKAEEVEQTAADAAMTVKGVHSAFTRTSIMQGRLPKAPWSEWITNGYHPAISGDLMVIDAPGVVGTGSTGTSHGSAWAYDTHIPILTRWKGQKAQKVARRVYTHDIASTLSTLLGIEYPNGNVGAPLYEALPAK